MEMQGNGTSLGPTGSQHKLIPVRVFLLSGTFSVLYLRNLIKIIWREFIRLKSLKNIKDSMGEDTMRWDDSMEQYTLYMGIKPANIRDSNKFIILLVNPLQ